MPHLMIREIHDSDPDRWTAALEVPHRLVPDRSPMWYEIDSGLFMAGWNTLYYDLNEEDPGEIREISKKGGYDEDRHRYQWFPGDILARYGDTIFQLRTPQATATAARVEMDQAEEWARY